MSDHPPLEHGNTITFAGTEFRVEVVSPTYTKLVPVTDPNWLLRHLEKVAVKDKK